MVFRIEVTDPALADAEQYVQFIRDVKMEPDAAERWFRGLVKAIHSLEQFPERFPLIPERLHFAIEIRQLIYFSHRIIFRIQSDGVVVLRIRHSSRRSVTAADFPIFDAGRT